MAEDFKGRVCVLSLGLVKFMTCKVSTGNVLLGDVSTFAAKM